MLILTPTSTSIEHKTERTNAFVTLVFGYSVVSLLFQSRTPYGINAFFGKAILGLIQAFSFNSLYFEIDSWNIHTHAIRRHLWTSMLWTTAHLPFIMAYVLAGASLSRLVLSTDCRDANPENLTENYAAKAYPDVPDGLRWYYCCGLSIALLCMGVISLCHEHKVFDGQRISKKTRICNRLAVSIALICLPLAKSLSSLHMVLISTVLVFFVLMVDVYGHTTVHDDFWKCDGHSKYRADCPIKKLILVDALKRGTRIKLEEVSTEDAEKGFYEVSQAFRNISGHLPY